MFSFKSNIPWYYFRVLIFWLQWKMSGERNSYYSTNTDPVTKHPCTNQPGIRFGPGFVLIVNRRSLPHAYCHHDNKSSPVLLKSSNHNVKINLNQENCLPDWTLTIARSERRICHISCMDLWCDDDLVHLLASWTFFFVLFPFFLFCFF